VTDTGPPLVPPPWLGPVDDMEDTPARILLAAAELFGQRGPSAVPLRAIAARAGVNYGLIHHYFKTKDAILAELLRRASATGAAWMTDTRTVDEALEQLVRSEATRHYSHMLAWAMLDNTDPRQLLTPSPAMTYLSDVIERQLRDNGVAGADPRIVTAVVVSAVLGWRFFRPFIMVSAQLDDRDEQQVASDVLAAIRSAAALMAGEEPIVEDEPG
jgi:TetR/AcrR family transcriptional regulator, repressor for neighboring sulfatase